MSDRLQTGFLATDSQRRREGVDVIRRNDDRADSTSDLLSVEEPLEIRLVSPDIDEMTLAITMRTPGQDHELALGFLFSEGIIHSLDQVSGIEHCRPPSPDKGFHNSLCVALAKGTPFSPEQLSRHIYTSSSCGVCGKTSIESVMNASVREIPATLNLAGSQLTRLPSFLRQQQQEFAQTGGIHAAGLIESDGSLSRVREDVGRHNAVDKLIGSLLLENALPLHQRGLMLSGRTGFELVQKAAIAGIELVAGIGPPSTLARELAEETGITLCGFVRDSGFNIYSHPHRIVVEA